MNAFRLFLGDQKLSLRNFFIAVWTLALFGIAVNGLFELWKLWPTLLLISKVPVVVDWPALGTCLMPTLGFLAWMICYVYPKLKALAGGNMVRTGQLKGVARHRGIIVALSKPFEKSDDIVKKIQNSCAPDSLYAIRGIGQIFKGIYHHYNNKLMYIWPLITSESKEYSKCLDEFVGKFMPHAKIYNEFDMCYIRTYDSESDTIINTKRRLAIIYSKENLNSIGLNHSDIIVDITGGTKAISIGLTFGALDSSIDIQYVEQTDYTVIPLAITPEILLDKLSGYLLELYMKLNQERGKTD